MLPDSTIGKDNRRTGRADSDLAENRISSKSRK